MARFYQFLLFYRRGKREAVIAELKGLANTILHPIDSFESAMYALSHLDEAYDAIKQAISNSWNREVVNGDWNSRAKWFGNVEAQVELAAVQLVAGTKGADKISTLGTVSKLGEVSKLRESVNIIQRVKNVMNSDKYRQFVDRLNSILIPKNEFTLAGANIVDSFSDSNVFKQIKEKLSNYQFFKGEGTGGEGKLKSTSELENHLKNREFTDANGKPYPNRKGIVGSHNADEFYKYDVKIVSKKKVYDVNGNEVKGVTEVEYNMPELDMAGNPKGPGIYGTKVHRKTIYDPKLMSDKEFVEKGMEAANDALSKESSGVIPREWIGIDSNGVKWNGYFENGKITSFFPTN